MQYSFLIEKFNGFTKLFNGKNLLFKLKNLHKLKSHVQFQIKSIDLQLNELSNSFDITNKKLIKRCVGMPVQNFAIIQKRYMKQYQMDIKPLVKKKLNLIQKLNDVKNEINSYTK